MPNEISHAFGHPQSRAEASGEVSLDRISVRDMVLEAEIGAFQAERGTTQRLRFNIVAEVVPADENLADDVDRILSYDRITEAVEAELQDTRLNLLETLASNIADRILVEPLAHRVFVRVEKLDRGPGNLGVEIERRRATAPAEVADVLVEEAPHPRILYLTEAESTSAHVSDWIDQVVGDAPVLICVGAPSLPAPDSRVAPAQRRIDLLAIEQQAWVLAGQDPRCVVVDSRTELDWGMKNDQISVWAPSKVVLDAHDAPKGADAVALTVWLAKELAALEIVTPSAVITHDVRCRSLVDG